MKNNPFVAIIILNWNGFNDTVECLNSLMKITYKNYRIILVDNCSKNNEADKLKNFFGDYIILIKNKENFGFAKGNNIGIKRALEMGADYVLCLNNDTVVDREFLTEMIKKANDVKIGMVGSRMLNFFDNSKIDNLGVTLTKSGLGFAIKNTDLKYFCPSGGSALYSAKMLKEISIDDDFFDSDFFMYVEDIDLAWRGLLLGYKAKFADKSIVYHKPSSSAKAGSDFSCYHGQRNHLWMMIKNLPKSILLKNSLYILFGQLASFTFYAKNAKLKIFFKSKKDALKNIRHFLTKRKKVQQKILISNEEIRKLFDKNIILTKY